MIDRRKKKDWELSPVLPDYDTGIDDFNSMSVGEACSTALGESRDDYSLEEILSHEVVKTTINFVEDLGFDWNEYSAYFNFDVKDVDDMIKVEIRTDLLSFESMQDLAEVLNPIIESYDPDAYFDFETETIMNAYVSKDADFINESTSRRLNSNQKNKLKDFVDKTDDTDEIETYLKGLLSN